MEILKSQGHGDLEVLVMEIQVEAFNCFNNLVQELPIEDVGGEGNVCINCTDKKYIFLKT